MQFQLLRRRIQTEQESRKETNKKWRTKGGEGRWEKQQKRWMRGLCRNSCTGSINIVSSTEAV
jgi:hypothetical protein